jgi:hypothetical protein
MTFTSVVNFTPLYILVAVLALLMLCCLLEGPPRA